MTSAPMSASIMVHHGPNHTCVRSSTLMSSNILSIIDSSEASRYPSRTYLILFRIDYAAKEDYLHRFLGILRAKEKLKSIKLSEDRVNSMVLPREKQTVLDWVDGNEKRLSDFHQLIWNYAEPAWREYRSAKAYVELLRKEGFNVVEGTGDMPTAFMATYGSGKPVIASYAEYDAVPGNSQKPLPYKAPRDGLHPWAAGHTDPHSALGVSALAGVLAAKEAMVEHGLKGTLKFFGEPAEKVCGSKPVHAAKGYFDDFDASICYHPSGYNTCNWETHSGAYWSVVFTFECVEPEKWFKPVHPGRIGGHAGGR